MVIAQVTALLLAWDVLRRRWSGRPPSALAGGNFYLKAQLLLLPGLFFGANITLTNIGIHLTAVNVHVLLRASALPWVVLLGVAVQKEPLPTVGVAAALATLFAGVLLVGAGAGGEVGLPAVVITLLSAACEACHVVSIRRAVVQLRAAAEAAAAGPAGGGGDGEEFLRLLSKMPATGPGISPPGSPTIHAAGGMAVLPRPDRPVVMKAGVVAPRAAAVAAGLHTRVQRAFPRGVVIGSVHVVRACAQAARPWLCRCALRCRSCSCSSSGCRCCSSLLSRWRRWPGRWLG